MGYDKTDQLAINTIRTLAVDATFNANSGHPGAPMGMAPVVRLRPMRSAASLSVPN